MFYKIIRFVNMKIHLLILVYFYLNILFYECLSEKKCFAPGSCSLQIGGKDISCRLTENINYDHVDGLVDTTSVPVRNLKQEYFPYEDNQTFTWIDISGEFEITGSSSVNHILIMMNEKKQSEKGKSYHLTFDREMLPNGIQNFNISCLHTEKYNAQNISVMPLISFENNSLTSSDLPLNNEGISKNECLRMERVRNWSPEIDIIANDYRQEVMVHINSYDKCNKTLEVNLYNATIHLDCSSKSKHVSHLQREYVIIKEKGDVIFSNLHPGNYCATIYLMNDKCISSRCQGIHTGTVNLNEPKSSVHTSTGRQITTLSPEYVIIIVVATVCGLMAAGIILYLKYLRLQTMIVNRQYVTSATDQVTDIEAQLQIINQKLPKSRILLLYSLENSGMDNVVFQFIKVLEECCFCKVIHTMNDNEINEIIKKSPSGWILYNIRHVDKIILIESQNTYHMQQCWINSEIIELSSNEDSALLSGFITIHNRECLNDYNQLAVVRFNFTPSNIKLEDVVESCRYILPSSLSALFLFIHSKHCNTNNNPETETLILSSEALQSFWKNESSVFNSFLQICQKNECNSS